MADKPCWSPTCCGRCSSSLTIIIGVAAWLFVLAQQSRRVGRRGNAAADRPSDPARSRRTSAPTPSCSGQGGRRSRQPGQEPLCRRPEPRAAHAAERHSRLCAAARAAIRRCPPSRAINAIKVVRRSAEHLSGLIDGTARHFEDRGRPAFISSATRCACRDFLDQLVGMFRLQADRQGHRLSSFKRPAVCRPWCYADEKRLRQILINLLSNAIKFTEAGQRDSSWSTTAPGRRVRSRATPASAFRRAISSASSQPFERGAHRRRAAADRHRTGPDHHQPAHRDHGRRHQGPQRRSATAARSASSCCCRKCRGRVSRPTMETRVRGYAGPRQTILVTDDDPVQRDLLRELLAPLGFIVLSAGSGRGCLALAEQPARSLPARHLDAGDGRLGGRGTAAPPAGQTRRDPDAFGQRASSRITCRRRAGSTTTC